MASTSASPTFLPSGSVKEPAKLVIPADELSSDSAGDDEPLYVDQDDAHSIFQPALSPAATRLTSPKTPAAEKAAAMEKQPDGGLFSYVNDPGTPASPPSAKGEPSSGALSPRKLVKTQNRTGSLSQSPPPQSYLPRPPSPWQSGPRSLVVQDEPGSKPVLSNLLGSTSHRRASSSGAEAFKRLRESLPSISLPSNFFSGLTSPSFLSGHSAHKQHQPVDARTTDSQDGAAESRLNVNANLPSPLRTMTPVHQRPLTTALEPNASSRPTSVALNRPRVIRRSTSDESMLYHSLSRVSSLGDDERWEHIREQTNSRLKAIKDSLDRPSFKLPNALKRNTLMSTDSLRSLSMTSATVPPAGSAVKDSNLSEFDRALELLTGDIVIMGGYRGSILRSTKTNRQVWVPVKVGLNIRKVNLEVGLEPGDEERMEETIYPSGMLQNIGPVDISRRLFKRLRECENAKNGKLRVWDYGWDWRLSPHLLSRKLVSFMEQLPSNQANNPGERGATVIAHSLGGLITRHAVNQRPDLFAGVIFAGTPQRCINILGPIRNGDAVLLNEKVLTAQVNFSLRTSFVFLPEDGYCFINKHTGEEFPVDFYNPEEWVKNCISPCVASVLPPYNVRQSSLGSLLNLSSSLPSLPMRSRGNSAASELRPALSPTRNTADAGRRLEIHTDRSLAPQMDTLPAGSKGAPQQLHNGNGNGRDQNLEYLTRTLADTKRFRAELCHQPELTESNSYPPFAVIYGKDIPTVYAAHVACRDVIPCADAYDNLLFQSGDGVVLAREAMLPPGYDVVKGGRVSTDRGHITILGDLRVVGKALEAVIKGRRKGIGKGNPTPEGKSLQVGESLQG